MSLPVQVVPPAPRAAGRLLAGVPPHVPPRLPAEKWRQPCGPAAPPGRPAACLSVVLTCPGRLGQTLSGHRKGGTTCIRVRVGGSAHALGRMNEGSKIIPDMLVAAGECPSRGSAVLLYLLRCCSVSSLASPCDRHPTQKAALQTQQQCGYISSSGGDGGSSVHSQQSCRTPQAATCPAAAPQARQQWAA